MTRRRNFLIAAAGLFLAVAIAAVMLPPCVVYAEGSSCSAGCKAAYGSCYKKSQDRSKCQAQLQRCLESCIRSRR